MGKARANVCSTNVSYFTYLLCFSVRLIGVGVISDLIKHLALWTFSPLIDWLLSWVTQLHLLLIWVMWVGLEAF